MRLSLPRLNACCRIGSWRDSRLKGWVMGSRESDSVALVLYDRTLLWLTFGLARSVLSW